MNKGLVRERGRDGRGRGAGQASGDHGISPLATINQLAERMQVTVEGMAASSAVVMTPVTAAALRAAPRLPGAAFLSPQPPATAGHPRLP